MEVKLGLRSLGFGSARHLSQHGTHDANTSKNAEDLMESRCCCRLIRASGARCCRSARHFGLTFVTLALTVDFITSCFLFSSATSRPLHSRSWTAPGRDGSHSRPPRSTGTLKSVCTACTPILRPFGIDPILPPSVERAVAVLGLARRYCRDSTGCVGRAQRSKRKGAAQSYASYRSHLSSALRGW